jgi:hypothetical protein
VREVPERVSSIVALCLSKDPGLRPPSVRALLEELEAVVTPGSLSLGDAVSGPGAEGLGATTHGTHVRSWKTARLSGNLRRFGLPSMFALFAAIAAWTFTRAPRSTRTASATPPVATSQATPPPHRDTSPALPLAGPSSRVDHAARSADVPSGEALAESVPLATPTSTIGATARRPRLGTAPPADAAVSDDDLELNERN